MSRWSRLEVSRPIAIIFASLFLLAVLLAISPSRGDWEHLSWQRLPVQNGAAIFSARLKRRGDEVTLRLVAFRPENFDFLVLDNGPSRATPRFRDLRTAVQSSGCIAGVNGGFFDPASFKPNGLMISDGMAAGEYDRENWATGIVVVREDELALEDSASFRPSREVKQLLQTGPWLVRDGSPPARFEGDHAAPRTFIAEGRSGTWVLGRCSAITLHDLSEMLGGTTFDRALEGKSKSALNLDGGPSSGFWAKADQSGEVHDPEQTLVRNFIALRPRVPGQNR